RQALARPACDEVAGNRQQEVIFSAPPPAGATDGAWRSVGLAANPPFAGPGGGISERSGGPFAPPTARYGYSPAKALPRVRETGHGMQKGKVRRPAAFAGR